MCAEVWRGCVGWERPWSEVLNAMTAFFQPVCSPASAALSVSGAYQRHFTWLSRGQPITGRLSEIFGLNALNSTSRSKHLHQVRAS